MLKRLYALFGIAVVAGYAYVAWNGIELAPSRREHVAGGPRGAHGHRSFWYSGYHGGK